MYQICVPSDHLNSPVDGVTPLSGHIMPANVNHHHHHLHHLHHHHCNNNEYGAPGMFLFLFVILSPDYITWLHMLPMQSHLVDILAFTFTLYSRTPLLPLHNKTWSSFVVVQRTSVFYLGRVVLHFFLNFNQALSFCIPYSPSLGNLAHRYNATHHVI